MRRHYVNREIEITLTNVSNGCEKVNEVKCVITLASLNRYINRETKHQKAEEYHAVLDKSEEALKIRKEIEGKNNKAGIVLDNTKAVVTDNLVDLPDAPLLLIASDNTSNNAKGRHLSWKKKAPVLFRVIGDNEDHYLISNGNIEKNYFKALKVSKQVYIAYLIAEGKTEELSEVADLSDIKQVLYYGKIREFVNGSLKPKFNFKKCRALLMQDMKERKGSSVKILSY